MAQYEEIIKSLNSDEIYSYQSLVSMVQEERPAYTVNACRWAVGDMVRDGDIIRLGYDAYSLPGDSRATYRPVYSEFATEVMRVIAKRFPMIHFVVFETVLMNEFLNHLIANNTVFIQADKDATMFVFRFLQEKGYNNVMYNPPIKDFSLYWAENSIIVKPLISESPTVPSSPHNVCIEKLLVDMYCDKIIRSTFSVAELPGVFSEAKRKYRIDRTKMMRYARRRNKEDDIRKLIEDE